MPKAADMVSLLTRRLLETTRDWLRGGRDRPALERLREEHRARCDRARYFDPPPARIMFLCQGNICRSAFAAGYWNARMRELSGAVPAAVSSGIHPVSGRRTPEWLAEIAAGHGVDLSGHRSRTITRDEAEAVEAIFVMDRANYRNLVARVPSVQGKTHFLAWFAGHGPDEIADPYDRGPEFGRRCCEQIMASVDGLMKHVLSP